MLGAVIGDIAGSVYEFSNTKDYNFEMFPTGSNFTDDTVMTMAVAEWALNNDICADIKAQTKLLESIIVDVAKNVPCPMGGYGAGFHTWLFHPERLIDYRTGRVASGRCPYNSWGNGSAMRTSSVGWLYDDMDTTLKVAETAASITHNHPEGIKGAQAVTAAIFMARNGASKEDIKKYITTKFHYNLDQSWEYLHDTYEWDSSCQGTVPQAIISFLSSDDFEGAIRRAISIGGDSDTLACITGSIAEAYYKDIPEYMVSKAMSLLPVRFRKVLGMMGEKGYYSIW
ncbi:ADP-ribosylglycohydrolase family protein [Bacteroides caecigallinarum]|uniref:ADP-ribosylglycohydrolase family protein n=1 Tax=Bacteroides caecigallinarum TaxID=1411144 RepID=UPI001F271896|nr:ADP-ribosylglycohydrolase family protein [Bacteroides caecigallinarum]MCF2582643.1 ADP-ribosylglycohydrolase family protein [Bacteroides caecigallinarum]